MHVCSAVGLAVVIISWSAFARLNASSALNLELLDGEPVVVLGGRAAAARACLAAIHLLYHAPGSLAAPCEFICLRLRCANPFVFRIGKELVRIGVELVEVRPSLELWLWLGFLANLDGGRSVCVG